ncbi:MAG: SPW repeat protein [Chloroflexi bacterium]|nr:SPW repeat protein [Chloroflexota bacterium]
MAHGLATPWAHFFAAILLGAWLMTSPVSLGYEDQGQTWSDIVSGALIMAFATVTLVRRPAWAPWANSLVGVWLLFAPLVFAPSAVAYANDTLSGALVITFVLLMPGMPGMRMLPGPDVPPGWSYNPSTWPQRAPIIALAFFGFALSRYMAAFQLGYIDSAWDPLFGDGTEQVLGSDVSEGFPISDAGLGAVAYMIEGLMAFMGDRQRWRTMPWMVMFFGILVVPLGIVSVTLIVLQPVAVGSWCTPCLLTGLAMLIMIAFTLDEVVAMGDFLVKARRAGESLWNAFWLGGTLPSDTRDERPVHPDVVTPQAMVWGVALPWTLLVSTALGIWLMASPSIFGSDGSAADSAHVIGALVVAVAIISWADVGRALRFINVLFGAWFIVAPWLLNGSTTGSAINDVVVGAVLIVLSLPRGPVGERYGSWGRFIR